MSPINSPPRATLYRKLSDSLNHQPLFDERDIRRNSSKKGRRRRRSARKKKLNDRQVDVDSVGWKFQTEVDSVGWKEGKAKPPTLISCFMTKLASERDLPTHLEYRRRSIICSPTDRDDTPMLREWKAKTPFVVDSLKYSSTKPSTIFINRATPTERGIQPPSKEEHKCEMMCGKSDWDPFGLESVALSPLSQSSAETHWQLDDWPE